MKLRTRLLGGGLSIGASALLAIVGVIAVVAIGETGAVNTTTASGVVQNGNTKYDAKCDVYLRATQQGQSNLGPDGVWYIRVSNPSESEIYTPAPGYIVAVVSDGKFVSYGGANGTDSVATNNVVPLCAIGEYADTTNNGGEYKAKASTTTTFADNSSKSDNFKVRQHRTVRIIKVTNGGGLPQDFTGTISDHAPAAWTAPGGEAPNGGTPLDITGVDDSAHSVAEDSPLPVDWTLNGFNVRSGLQADCSAVTGYSGDHADIPADGDDYTVCISNTYDPPDVPRTRTVRIIKVTSGGGLPQDFSGTIAPHTPGTWTVAGGASPNGGTPFDITGVAEGGQTVIESSPLPTDWDFDGYAVVAGLQDDCSAVADYTGVQATGAAVPETGDQTVCISNTYDPPDVPQTRTVRIIKVTNGGGLPQDFSGTISPHAPADWTVAGGSAPNGGTPFDITGVAEVGQTVIESSPLPTDWDFDGYAVLAGLQANCSTVVAYSGDQATGASVPETGDQTVCISNTFDPPDLPETRTIQVIKVTSISSAVLFSGTVEPHGGGAWLVQGGTGAAGGSPDTFNGVAETAQTVVENVPPPGWVFGGYAALPGLVDCSSLDAADYSGSRAAGASVAATGNWTVCVFNVFVPETPPIQEPPIVVNVPEPEPSPSPSPTASPEPTETASPEPTDDNVVSPETPTATTTPIPTTPSGGVISPSTPLPPTAGTGAVGNSGNSWLALSGLGLVIMIAAATLAYATSERRR